MSLLHLSPLPLFFLSPPSVPEAFCGTRSGDATSWLGVRFGNTSENWSSPLVTSGHSQLSKVPRKSVLLLLSVASFSHLASGLSLIRMTRTAASPTAMIETQRAVPVERFRRTPANGFGAHRLLLSQRICSCGSFHSVIMSFRNWFQLLQQTAGC